MFLTNPPADDICLNIITWWWNDACQYWHMRRKLIIFPGNNWTCSCNYSISALCYLWQAAASAGEVVITTQKLANYDGGQDACISNCWACWAHWHAISRAIVRSHFMASRFILIIRVCLRLASMGEFTPWLFNAGGHNANRRDYRSPKDPHEVFLLTGIPFCSSHFRDSCRGHEYRRSVQQILSVAPQSGKSSPH